MKEECGMTLGKPIYHFTPPANWMNDPNGLIFHEGVIRERKPVGVSQRNAFRLHDKAVLMYSPSDKVKYLAGSMGDALQFVKLVQPKN